MAIGRQSEMFLDGAAESIQLVHYDPGMVVRTCARACHTGATGASTAHMAMPATFCGCGAATTSLSGLRFSTLQYSILTGGANPSW